MVTFVGTQPDLDDAVKELIELEYDAIGAYELAIEKLDSFAYKAKLEEFLVDHKQYIIQINEFYKDKPVNLPHLGDLIKGSLAKFKVALGNITGDKSILKAMLTNEIDINTAYERMNNHKDVKNNPALLLILRSGYEDVLRHKKWLEDQTVTFAEIG
ncbi:MAG: ferritin-like protein [Burkholderiales bacterium]|jgi:hypothetical protein|nr:ferritin-like protein [Burkholderiales bacterium]